MSDAKAPSPSAARTLTVLETLIGAEDGLTLTALSRESNVPLATCASIVYTLEQRGYASRNVVGRSHFWRATLGIYGLASQLVRNVDLASVAQVELRDLAVKLGMPVHVGILSGSSVIYVAKGAAAGFIQFDTYVGKMAPFNLTALGKAITAYFDEERLAPLLGQLSVGQGPRAIAAGVQPFLDQLDFVREQGYAVEREEEQSDISCVAVPFFGADGSAAGSVGATGFDRDLVGETFDLAVEGLRTVARTISERLGYHGPLTSDKK